MSLTSLALAGGFFTTSASRYFLVINSKILKDVSKKLIVVISKHTFKFRYLSSTSNFIFMSISSAQWLSHVRLFANPRTAAHQGSLSITNSQSLLKLIKSVMPSNHLILCCPFSSCLQSFPASGSFSVSQFFTSGGQSIGVSTSAGAGALGAADLGMA